MAERVRFPSTDGPMLAGLIDHPEGETRGWGVFAHGFTLGKDSAAASRICKRLAAEGIGMLRFDNLGLGDSEGDWGDGSFSDRVADTAQAVRYLSDTGREARLLVGHSFGGAAVIAAAHLLDSVQRGGEHRSAVRPEPHRAPLRRPRRADHGGGRGAVPDRRQGAHPQARTSSRRCARRTCASGSTPCTGRCW